MFLILAWKCSSNRTLKPSVISTCHSLCGHGIYRCLQGIESLQIKECFATMVRIKEAYLNLHECFETYGESYSLISKWQYSFLVLDSRLEETDLTDLLSTKTDLNLHRVVAVLHIYQRTTTTMIFLVLNHKRHESISNNHNINTACHTVKQLCVENIHNNQGQSVNS